MANILRTSSSRSGDTALATKALDREREALCLIPKDHPDRVILCLNLAFSLWTRFKQIGDVALLDEAVNLEREALHLCPEGNLHRARSCQSLASSLWTRFSQTGDMLLLDEAIELQSEGLRLQPEGHPDRAISCGNLASLLWTRFNEIQDMALLNQALALEREALRLRPEGHPQRATSCVGLATSLFTRFNQTSNVEFLDEALELQREALRLRPIGHADHAFICSRLAEFLRACFNQTRDTAMLDEAQSHCIQAIQGSAMSPFDHVCVRVELARICALPAYPLHDVSAAITHLSGITQHRAGLIPNFYAVNHTLHLCVTAISSHDEHTRLLTINRILIEALPELGSVVLNKISRLRRWRETGILPLEAFLHALKVKKIADGLELLEQGRAVLWSQTLAMRDLQLEGLSPVLKIELRFLQQSMSTFARSGNKQRLDLTARDQAHTSYARLQQLIKEIRAYPGRERFMRGPSYAELVQVASAHPVIILAAHDTVCHALIIPSASALPVHLILDTVTALDIKGLAHNIRGLDSNVNAMSGPAVDTELRGMLVSGRRKDQAIRKLHQSLKRLWVSIVKPILDCLGLGVRKIRFRAPHY
jgi:hypothetical protein